MVKNDSDILENAYFGFCSPKIRINRTRKNTVAKGVSLADHIKTATGGLEMKETPVLAMGLTSEGVFLRRRNIGISLIAARPPERLDGGWSRRIVMRLDHSKFFFSCDRVRAKNIPVRTGSARKNSGAIAL